MAVNLEQDTRKFVLREYLAEVEQKGAAYIPNFLKPEAIENLQQICNSLEFIKKENKYKTGVVESFYVPKEVPQGVSERIDLLKEQVRNRLFGYSIRFPALSGWYPNEVSIQKYDSSSFITSHRDNKSINILVAVLSVQGEADFIVRNERNGDPSRRWRLKPGDLTILRSQGFNRNLNSHPSVFHEITGALTDEPRISIGFRQV